MIYWSAPCQWPWTILSDSAIFFLHEADRSCLYTINKSRCDVSTVLPIDGTKIKTTTVIQIILFHYFQIILSSKPRRFSYSCCLYLLTAHLREAQPFRHYFYSVVQKLRFRPAGATCCPDKREIWHERAGRPLLRAKFHVYQGRNVEIQPLKLSKFRILAINLCLKGTIFAKFSAFARVYI